MLQCRPAQEFSFGPRALKDALLSTDPALRQLYTSAFSPAERLFLAEAYNPRRTFFCTLLIRTAFDWLLSRPEVPEDFETFHAALAPRKQSLARKHIYLQPIDLSEGPAGGALLDQLRSCTEAFFLGLQVRCLPSVAAASIHCSSRPSQDSDRLQLHTEVCGDWTTQPSVHRKTQGHTEQPPIPRLQCLKKLFFVFHSACLVISQWQTAASLPRWAQPSPAPEGLSGARGAMAGLGPAPPALGGRRHHACCCFRPTRGKPSTCPGAPGAVLDATGEKRTLRWSPSVHDYGILSFLKSSKPGDALCVLGLTLSDLYPREAWTFTFGTFLPGHEVGICSFARFSGESLQWGPSTPDPAPEAPLEDRGRTVCFSALGMVQCCKVTCHELCHLLGLGNCRWLRCLMQGALSLDEALRRPPDLCPICLRKLQHVLGFKLVDRYKRLYTWTLAAAGTRPGPAAGEPSVSEDTLPCSADSGLCGESDSEPGSGLSEPLSPDAWSHALPAGPELELEPEDGLGSLAAAESPGEALAEHGRWLAACIQALERDVTEEELARVDGAVDALARWDLFTGRLPAPRQDPPCGRDGAGLRRVLGDKFSSLRRKLSARKPSRAEASSRRRKAEDD
ncbi:hypothetical protein J1605_019531 [Eschrichtius robustus]|uniref:Archaemetzincin-1 n=1 Tax=Eschrichtius robustus TaxID=9764 RepID=A0AB34HNX0_ESCRO|nr:hypothetical protein J1605_019531 [Eschrichtius robustus]